MAVRTDTALEVKPELYNKGATPWDLDHLVWGWDGRSGLGREEVSRFRDLAPEHEDDGRSW